jgi:hypothetical protein
MMTSCRVRSSFERSSAEVRFHESKAFAAGLDRALGLGPAGFRHDADLAARRRVEDIDGLTRVGLHPLAADQVRFAYEMLVGPGHCPLS